MAKRTAEEIAGKSGKNEINGCKVRLIIRLSGKIMPDNTCLPPQELLFY